MKYILIVLLMLVVVAGGWWVYKQDFIFFDPRAETKKLGVLSLGKYDFDSLRERGGIVGDYEILGKIKEVEERRINCKGKTCMKLKDIDFETRQIRYKSEGKWITGMMNRPKVGDKFPVIIMIRGYADTAGYYSGSGSWRMADKLAKEGYVTVSTDFLGFSQSDMPSDDILEARFEKVNAVLDLISTVKQLDFVDPYRIGIWAHSNGGQIALSVLEVTGENMPAVLWAPMTNPFPQSVIDTTSDDEPGRIVRAKIEDFGKKYDYRRYAFENYYAWINSPVVIHQGTADEWCEVEWQTEVVNSLKELGKDAELRVYAGDDHNLSKNWEEVVKEDITFYKKFF